MAIKYGYKVLDTYKTIVVKNMLPRANPVPNCKYKKLLPTDR